MDSICDGTNIFPVLHLDRWRAPDSFEGFHLDRPVLATSGAYDCPSWTILRPASR